MHSRKNQRPGKSRPGPYKKDKTRRPRTKSDGAASRRPFGDKPDRPAGSGDARPHRSPGPGRKYGDRPPASRGKKSYGPRTQRDGTPSGSRPYRDRTERPGGRSGESPRTGKGPWKTGDKPFADRGKGGFGSRTQRSGVKAGRGDDRAGGRDGKNARAGGPPRKYGDKPVAGRGRKDFSKKREWTAARAGEPRPKGAYRQDRHRERDDSPATTRSRRGGAPPAALPADGPVRLNRYIATAGICSRREADELIAAGLVTVNGKTVTELGTKVMPGDDVRYDNRKLHGERLRYVLLNKPKDFITTVDDPEKRNTVMQLVSRACRERIYPVGRLDRNSTGVLLFTNDGDLTRKLTHPSTNIAKVYHVELDRRLTAEDMERVSAGVELDDGPTRVDEIAWAHPTDKRQVGIQLHSGKNRVVRRIFEALGYDVRKLDRVVFAGLTKKDLPRGRWRFLTEAEISMLKMLRGSNQPQPS